MVNLAFNGTLTLTNTITVAINTVLMASNQNVTISGNNAVQLFIVPPSVTFVMSNLVLANGLASGAGGAISNSGTVQVVGCLFTNNGAEGQAAYAYSGPVEIPGQGGAIFNTGILLVHNALFVSNWAEGGASVTDGPFGQGMAESHGEGGAIFNAETLLVTNASFLSNLAEGGGGNSAGLSLYAGSGGNGFGGAIYNTNYAVMDSCRFNANSAIGGLPGAYDCDPNGSHNGPIGPGAAGSDASGGAIYNSSTLLIWTVVRSCSLFQPKNIGVATAGQADFGCEKFLEGNAFG